MATRLRRLRIERFRDVEPGTELRFSDRWNVLLGRNGSGKTTLLHLVSMVLRDDLTALRGEPFEIAYDLSMPGGDVSVTVRNAPAEEPLARGRGYKATTRALGREEGGASWEVVIGEGEPMRVTGDPRVVAPQDPLAGARRTATVFALPLKGDRPGSAMFEWSAADQASNRYRIDEGVAMFDAIVGAQHHPRASVPSRCGVGLLEHLGGVALVGETFLPPAVGQAMARSFDRGRPTIEFELGGDALLDRCVQLLDAPAVTVIAKPIDGEAASRVGSAYGRFEFYVRRGEGRFVHHDQWSFGQQRLLTIFWYLACSPDAVVADELVNGLHWEWIEACVEAIGERQVFIALQNPLLLEHVGVSSPEDARRMFVLCRTALHEGLHGMVWIQPDERQADRFYRAWSTGIQPVHEVLKTEGLW